jgi:DNA-binding Lrp family transcriptional regulator
MLNNSLSLFYKMRRKVVELDDLDIALLNKLRYRANKSLTILSRELEVPISTVRYRIKRLEEQGVIQGYVAIVDRDNLGYKISLVLEVETVPKMVERVAKDMSQINEIVRIYELDSGPKLHVHALFKDEREAYSFITDKLYNLRGVISVSTSRIIKRYKVDPSIIV